MPIETEPMLENAICILGYELEEASILFPLLTALTRIGCEEEGYRDDLLQNPERYLYEGKIVAVVSYWCYITSLNMQLATRDEDEHLDVRLDIDKGFAREHRARIIEIALPIYAHAKFAYACDMSGVDIFDGKSSGWSFRDQASKELNALFDSIG